MPWTSYLEAVAEGNIRLAKVRDKFPSLGAYPVLARRGHQIEMGTDLPAMMKGFPVLFANTPAKLEMMALLEEKGGKAEKPSSKKRSEKAERKMKRLRELAELLMTDGRVRIELRFRNLDYERIWELQQDDLIDRQHTPQSKSSIRIVLGALAGLFRGPIGINVERSF